MKKIAESTTKASSSATNGTSSSEIAVLLQSLEQTCGYGDPLTNAARVTSENLIRRTPATVLDRLIALAVRGEGTVAGLTFDPVAAKAALAAADEADAVATAAQMLARRAQDQAIRLRACVTRDARGIRMALRGYVKTAQGESLEQENDELRTLVRQHRAAAKARKTRAESAVKEAVAAARGETAGAGEAAGAVAVTGAGDPDAL